MRGGWKGIVAQNLGFPYFPGFFAYVGIGETLSSMAHLQQPFSNVQLELLKLFSEDVPESDLIEIKRILAAYRLSKAREAADQQWEEKGWTVEDMERLLHQHTRTPYTSWQDEEAEE